MQKYSPLYWLLHNKNPVALNVATQWDLMWQSAYIYLLSTFLKQLFLCSSIIINVMFHCVSITFTLHSFQLIILITY